MRNQFFVEIRVEIFFLVYSKVDLLQNGNCRSCFGEIEGWRGRVKFGFESRGEGRWLKDLNVEQNSRINMGKKFGKIIVCRFLIGVEM